MTFMNKKVRLILSIVLAVAAIACVVCAIVFNKSDNKPVTSTVSETTTTTSTKSAANGITTGPTIATKGTVQTTKAEVSKETSEDPDVGDDIIATKVSQKNTNGTTKKPVNTYPSKQAKQPKDNANHVSIHGGDIQCKKGDRIAVPVYMTTNPGIWALVFEAKYDSSVLKYADVDKGSDFEFLSIMKADRPLFQATNGPLENFKNTGLIAVFYFDALKTGTTKLEFYYTSKGNIINVDGDEIPIDFYNPTITVS